MCNRYVKQEETIEKGRELGNRERERKEGKEKNEKRKVQWNIAL